MRDYPIKTPPQLGSVLQGYRKEQAKFGEYRTRRLVLYAWDKLPPA